MKTLKLVSFMLLFISMYIAPTETSAQPRGNRIHSNQYNQRGGDDAFQHRNRNYRGHHRNYPRGLNVHRRFVTPPPPPCMHCRTRRHSRAVFCRHIPIMPRRMACRR